MYRSANENHTRKSVDFEKHMLFTACTTIIGEDGGIIVARNGYKWRLVAFWCDYSKSIKAGCDANDLEREAVANFRFVNLSDRMIETYRRQAAEAA
jgi:hypothetical protein